MCEQNSTTTVITYETCPCLMDCTDMEHILCYRTDETKQISISVQLSKSSHVPTAFFLLSRMTLWLFTSLECSYSQTDYEALYRQMFTHIQWNDPVQLRLFKDHRQTVFYQLMAPLSAVMWCPCASVHSVAPEAYECFIYCNSRGRHTASRLY